MILSGIVHYLTDRIGVILSSIVRYRRDRSRDRFSPAPIIIEQILHGRVHFPQIALAARCTLAAESNFVSNQSFIGEF